MRFLKDVPVTIMAMYDINSREKIIIIHVVCNIYDLTMSFFNIYVTLLS